MDEMTDIPRTDELNVIKIPDGHWIDGWGDEVWVKNGGYHRTDGPAVELANGTKKWYWDGQRHRADGPAIEWPCGSKRWLLNGTYCYSFEEWLETNNEITDKQKLMLKLKYG